MDQKSGRARRSILIVEDDATTRLALVRLLEHLEYQIIPVATVAESMELLDGQDYAIIDLNLPDGLGTTILRRIRDENRPIRVAVTTAAEGPVFDEARKLEPELLLRKPINVNALLQWLCDPP
jgi:CheY-like chemotaxis protein